MPSVGNAEGGGPVKEKCVMRRIACMMKRFKKVRVRKKKWMI